ncbi:hypothetical protein AYL99_10969 [Fonsecaea erecta]|uniref:Uncharacterized protein n=1 Tax=Fonsecaea erecta TaxID=1367422 RepID=A0A178Z4S3_9EURO|nr:hypothetical protein AYL99_10969 [Fonsecaea erecta]OAP54521.1 hypothetical protein AYL99_10969 [Fonsecaea erecta]
MRPKPHIVQIARTFLPFVLSRKFHMAPSKNPAIVRLAKDDGELSNGGVLRPREAMETARSWKHLHRFTPQQMADQPLFHELPDDFPDIQGKLDAFNCTAVPFTVFDISLVKDD